MTRAQYLQAREAMELVARLVGEMALVDFLSTIDQAERDGPAKNPRMWAEGHEQLVKDRQLATALAVLQKLIAS